TVKDIFSVVIDEKLTVNNLKDKIKNAWQDSQEIKINLYKKDFAQDNNALVSAVNESEKRQEVLIDPQKNISQYFSTEDTTQQKDPINIIIYPR
ncbi:13984_t:CDS:1, partial [Funneliformis caledonium]